jgi:hypothetical protein
VISTGTTTALIQRSNGKRRMRDGKIVRGEEYFDRDQALKAAGLQE